MRDINILFSDGRIIATTVNHARVEIDITRDSTAVILNSICNYYWRQEDLVDLIRVLIRAKEIMRRNVEQSHPPTSEDDDGVEVRTRDEY